MGGGKKVKTMPPAERPDPVPDPVPVDVETLEKQRDRRRQRLRARGRAGTILTMGGLGESEVRKATLLGGS